MIKPTLISLMILPLVGCAGWGSSAINTCGGTHSQRIMLHYGDSELKVTPRVAKVRRQSAMVFRLNPSKRANDPVDYETVTVTVAGKTPNDSWISGSGTHNTAPRHEIVVCVPDDQAYAVYEYLFEVDQVGTLDPRAEVEL